MSWFGFQVFTEKEVRAKSATTLPAAFQIGDNVKLWLDEVPEVGFLGIPAVIAGAKYIRGVIFYDIAVKIEGTPFYSILKDVRAWVTPPHFTKCPPNGGLDELTPEVEEYLRSQGEPIIPQPEGRPALRLVPVPLDLPSLDLGPSQAED
jgi:hypothetical protein